WRSCRWPRSSRGGTSTRDFDDAQMAELTESVRLHGIISPLMLAPDGAGGFTIIAGERRYRAGQAAKLRAVPPPVRDGDEASLTLAVAENVIRVDLSPLEEAHAYRRLVEEHGDRAEGCADGRQEREADRRARRAATAPRRHASSDRGAH